MVCVVAFSSWQCVTSLGFNCSTCASKLEPRRSCSLSQRQRGNQCRNSSNPNRRAAGLTCSSTRCFRTREPGMTACPYCRESCHCRPLLPFGSWRGRFCLASIGALCDECGCQLLRLPSLLNLRRSEEARPAWAADVQRLVGCLIAHFVLRLFLYRLCANRFCSLLSTAGCYSWHWR